MEKYSAITSPQASFAGYREALRLAVPPSIPYIGVNLGDLTFIEEGNPDTIEGGLVNFAKFKMVATAIMELRQFQLQPYNLTRIEPIQQFISSIQVANEKECFDLSLIAEPRTPQS
eukprot:TRINITY_DN2377_c0_g2_i5.p1 TRINITY_DN2377_c0_g2~~TRINITY_DN2377_c0_g2_i5.p1  ORF type:complete len:116 (-),score=20.75 TRINITY_DN2377_c0_g2_i5:138-485(-)